MEIFDTAFALEAMYKAHRLAENESEAEQFLKEAQVAGEAIKSKEDRDYFLTELGD